MGRIPGVPVDLRGVNGGRFCECVTDTDCRSGLACSDVGGLCNIPVADHPAIGLICPDGKLSAHMPSRVCARPEALSDWAMSLSADCADDPDDEYYYSELRCTVWNGIEQRLRCLKDDDCLTSGRACRCVTGTCYDEEDGANCDLMCGNYCASTCEDDLDCGPSSGGNVKSCVGDEVFVHGYCVDPAGTCDDVYSCCAPGWKCHDMYSILKKVALPNLCWPLLSVSVDRTYCGCETNDDCLNGKECTDVSGVCGISGDVTGLVEVMCPGGTLALGIPPKLCGSVDEFLTGHPQAPEQSNTR